MPHVKKKKKNKSYVGLIKLYIGFSNSQVGDITYLGDNKCYGWGIITYVGLIITYVGVSNSYVWVRYLQQILSPIISYVGLTKSYVGDNISCLELSKWMVLSWWETGKLRPNFRKAAPNDPKWPWYGQDQTY